MATVSKPFPPVIPARTPRPLAPHPGLEVSLEPHLPAAVEARAAILSLLNQTALWRALFVALCLATFAGVGAIYLTSLTGYLSVEGDNAIYIILGKALATGQGYMNVQGSVPRIESQYPPLFPLLLAPLVRLWGTDGVVQMQALVACFALASFAVSFFLFRRWLGSAVLAFAIVLASASSDLVWEFSHKVLTEIPYLFFTLLACWWASDYAAQSRWLTRAGTLAVLAAVAAFMTRTIGLSICAMLPLYLLLGPPIRLRGGAVDEGERQRHRQSEQAEQPPPRVAVAAGKHGGGDQGRHQHQIGAAVLRDSDPFVGAVNLVGNLRQACFRVR